MLEGQQDELNVQNTSRNEFIFRNRAVLRWQGKGLRNFLTHAFVGD